MTARFRPAAGPEDPDRPGDACRGKSDEWARGYAAGWDHGYAAAAAPWRRAIERIADAVGVELLSRPALPRGRVWILWDRKRKKGRSPCV